MATEKKALAGFAPASAPKHTIVGIKVKFELNAQNGRRRILFGLEKNTDDDEVVWKIHFQLFERDKKADPFGDALITLDIEVDAKLNNRAEVAAKNGLTVGQSAHAMGPGATDAKALAAGEIDEEEAGETIQATLKKK